jgi:hypothetical protein
MGILYPPVFSPDLRSCFAVPARSLATQSACAIPLMLVAGLFPAFAHRENRATAPREQRKQDATHTPPVLLALPVGESGEKDFSGHRLSGLP